MQDTYFSSPQAKIYLNNILLDECYDITYTYRENKEPIYGYLDKYFAAIVPGTVIVHGAFTINYKADNYLKVAIEKANDPTNTKNLTGSEKANDKQKITSEKTFNDKYKTSLSEYADTQKSLKDLQTEARNLDLNMPSLKTLFEKEKQEYQVKADEAATNVKRTEAEIEALKANSSNRNLLEANIDTYYGKYDFTMPGDTKDSPGNYASTLKNAKSITLDLTQREINTSTEKISGINQQISNTNENLNILIAQRDSLESQINNQSPEQKKLTQAQIINKQNQIDQLQINNNGLINSLDIVKIKKESQVKDFADTINIFSKQKEDYLVSKPDVKVVVDKYTDLSEQQLILNDANKNLTEAKNYEKPNGKAYKDATLRSVVVSGDINKTRGNLAGQISGLQELKNGMNSSRVTSQDLKSDKWNKMANEDNALKRAEDYPYFEIEFTFNGETHKKIKGCQLMGHVHTIQMGGQPIKEYYTFLAKTVE